MARDYKHQGRGRQNQPPIGVAWWKWLLVAFLVGMFVWFLLSLQDSEPDSMPKKGVTQSLKTPKLESKKAKKQPVEKAEKDSKEPRFDFYALLQEEQKFIVPEHEMKTRVREERLGKAKASKYVIQAGSFKNFSDADKLRARLALMGIESRVEKEKIKNVIWNRVRMGPYSRMSSVSTIKSRLTKEGIQLMVIEVKG